MNKNKQRQIEVHAHWVGLLHPTLMGTLSEVPSRGKEIFSFAYSDSWLISSHAHTLDPSSLQPIS